jgi:hypothetical protein
MGGDAVLPPWDGRERVVLFNPDDLPVRRLRPVPAA